MGTEVTILTVFHTINLPRCCYPANSGSLLREFGVAIQPSPHKVSGHGDQLLTVHKH